jgi:hypothetical protein
MKTAALDDLLTWASGEFRVTWERMCHISHRLSLGAELSPEEARVRVLFTPLEVDYAALYPLMGALLRTVLFQPARLGTVIHDGTGRVIRAYHEDTREGHYVALQPLNLPEVVTLDGPQLLDLVQQQSATQGLPRLDWVKIADIRFFELFREAGYDPRKLFVAARTAIERDWIRFHPLPPAFQALIRWMKRFHHFNPEQIQIASLPLPDIAIGIHGSDFTTIVHPRRLAIRTAHEPSFSGLAKNIVGRGIASKSITVRIEPILHSLRRWLQREQWDLYFSSEHLYAVGQFAKRLGEAWDLAPRPTGLSRFTLWLSRWLFLPLDIDFVLQRGVAAVLHEVIAKSGESRFGLILSEKKKIVGAFEFRFLDGAVEEIRTHPPEQFNFALDFTHPFGYKSALPVVAIDLDVVREWLTFGEVTWTEKIRIASRNPVSFYPDSLARKIPRRRRWWVWQIFRLPFLRR